MIYNNENLGLGEVEAFYNNYLKVSSEDGKKSLHLSFNSNELGLDKIEYNKKENIRKYLYWDNTFETEETYYLFDTTKDEIYLTKIEENKYRLEVNIENPDMIYCPLGNNASFNNLKIDVEFSFTY